MIPKIHQATSGGRHLWLFATELLNAVHRSHIPIRVTIFPLVSGDVDRLYRMLRRCFAIQFDQVFGGLQTDQMQGALALLTEKLAKDWPAQCR